MPDNLAQRIADELVRRDITNLRLAEGDAVQMRRLIDGLTDELIVQLARRDPSAVGKAAGAARLERVITDARATIRDAYREMWREERKNIIDAAMDERNVIPSAVANGLGTTQTVANRLVSGTVDRAVVVDIVDNRVVSANATDAERLRGFFEREAGAHYRRYTGALRQAFSQDETLSQMVQRLKDLSDISARGVDGILRTGYNHTVNQLRVEMMGRNSHLFRGVIWISILDFRTTLICSSRSRGMWDATTGRPLPESPLQAKYPGPPPAHFSCRSQVYPLTRAPRDIGRMGGDEVQGALDSLTDDQRALLTPDPPDDETYTQWLRRQSAAVQNEVLGPARRKLWLDGVPLSDMVTQKGRPLTVQQIQRKKDRAA